MENVHCEKVRDTLLARRENGQGSEGENLLERLVDCFWFHRYLSLILIVFRLDLGMGEACLESFVTFAHDLLELILQNVRAAEFEGLPLFTIDEWWKHRTTSNSLPLVQLAVNLKTSNTALVLCHTHLALVMLFIVSFQAKTFKPLSLFSSYVRQCLFKDLHSSRFETPYNDYELNDARMKYLTAVVYAIAQSVSSDENSGME